MTVMTAAKMREEAARAREIADQLARDAAAATAAEIEASRPRCPTIAEGDNPVIYFTKYQAGREYGYAAIGWRTGRSVRWAVTGNTTDRFNWPGLLAFIGEANWPSIVRMTGAEHLLPPGAEPPVAEQMGRYGRVLGTRTVDTVTPYTG